MRKSTVDAHRWVFDLARFDEPADPPADPPAPPADPPAPQDDPPAPPADPPDPDTGKDADIAKWKALARKHEDRATANAAKAKKFDEIEDANKTEAEKLTAAKEAAEAKADAAISRAVKAEIKALASNDFADATDAESAIDPKQFVDDNGEIDTEGIKARLAEILETKPHWRKTTSAPAPTPRPDPGQGPRPTPIATNFKDADKATFAAELAKYGVRPKSS